MNEHRIPTRSISRRVTGRRENVAPGFNVRRPFPTPELQQVDPFLLLDHMGPIRLEPGQGSGVSDHPHRGFEAVSIIFDGSVEHRDSRGNHGVIGPGDVQWMTAGSGIIHSEMLEPTFHENGGRMHGIQLWVNLPRRDKMTEPGYQTLAASDIPVINDPAGGSHMRVIAGAVGAVRGPAVTRTPIMAVHVQLDPGGNLAVAVPETFNALAYITEGEGFAGSVAVADGEALVYAHDGQQVEFAAGPGGMSLMLLAGEPLNEPVVSYGPFVMNSKQEILQAIDDYKRGLMGTIEPLPQSPAAGVTASHHT